MARIPYTQLLRLALFAALIIGAFWAYHSLGLNDLKHSFFLKWGWRGKLVFTGIYVIFVTFGLPNLPFQLAAGAIYGSTQAFFMMYFGVNAGALGAFVLARTLGRKAVEELGGVRVRRLNESIQRGGFRLLILMRLIPLMPFNATNYASGLSRLPLREYLFANVIGTIPLTYVHVMLGHAAGTLNLKNPRDWLNPQLMLPLGVAAIALVIAFWLQKRWHMSKQRSDHGS